MTAYKLLHRRKDGSLGPLFINKRQRVPVGVWLEAESHPTPGYKLNPYWHCVKMPTAPHLTLNDRVWCKVQIEDFIPYKRPAAQGGEWLLAKRMKIIAVCDYAAA